MGEVDSNVLRISTPFAGGMGGSGEGLCGALVGGMMVIGAIHGRLDAETNDDHCMDLVKSYQAQFNKHFDFSICTDLKENWVGKQGQENCAELTAQAAGILLDILEAE